MFKIAFLDSVLQTFSINSILINYYLLVRIHTEKSNAIIFFGWRMFLYCCSFLGLRRPRNQIFGTKFEFFWRNFIFLEPNFNFLDEILIFWTKFDFFVMKFNFWTLPRRWNFGFWSGAGILDSGFWARDKISVTKKSKNH